MPLHNEGALDALFAAVDWAASGNLAAAWCLGDARVDGELVKLRADGAVVGGQSELVESVMDAGSDSLVTAAAQRRRRAGLVGDALLAAAED